MYKLYGKSYRRSQEWLNRLYKPGTSFLFEFEFKFFLISIYLKGDITKYQLEQEEDFSLSDELDIYKGVHTQTSEFFINFTETFNTLSNTPNHTANLPLQEDMILSLKGKRMYWTLKKNTYGNVVFTPSSKSVDFF